MGMLFPTADGTYVGVTPDGNKKAIAMLQSTSKISLSARLVGFDRDRAFYPTVLICIMCIICNDAMAAFLPVTVIGSNSASLLFGVRRMHPASDASPVLSRTRSDP